MTEYINTEPIPKVVWIPFVSFLLFIAIGYYYYNYEKDGIDTKCLQEEGQIFCNQQQPGNLLYTIKENKIFSCYSNPNSIFLFPEEILDKCNLHRGIFK